MLVAVRKEASLIGAYFYTKDEVSKGWEQAEPRHSNKPWNVFSCLAPAIKRRARVDAAYHVLTAIFDDADRFIDGALQHDVTRLLTMGNSAFPVFSHCCCVL